MVSFDFLFSSRAANGGDDDTSDTESTTSTLSSSSSTPDEDDPSPSLLICQSLQDLEIGRKDGFKFVKDLGVVSHRIVSALKNRFIISDHLTELEHCLMELIATIFIEYSGTCKPRGYFAANIDRRLQHEIFGELQDLELYLNGIVDKATLSLTDKEYLGIFRRSLRSSCDQIKIWSGLSDEQSYPIACAILGQTPVPDRLASIKSTATSPPPPHESSPSRINEINQIKEDAKLASLIDAQEWEDWAAEAKAEAVQAGLSGSKQKEPKRRKTRKYHSKTTFLSSGNGGHYYYHATPSADVQSSWYPSAFTPPVFVPHMHHTGPPSFHTTVHTGSRGSSSSHTVNYSVDSNNTSFTSIRNSFNHP